jgi:Ca2+-transporting ATPase
VILVAALLAGYPPPLVAVQILWVNLVTDGAVTVTLIMEPLEGDEMKQSPVPSDEPLVTSSMLRRMLLVVPAMAVSTLGYFIFLLSTDVPFIHARTAAFTVLAATQWFNVLNCRSERESAFRFSFQRNKWLMGGLAAGIVLQMAVVYFPPLNSVFHTVPLPLNELLVLLFISSLVFWIEEIRKFFVRRRREN